MNIPGKIVEFRRYDPIPDAPVSMGVVVDDTGNIYDAVTMEPWFPAEGRWRLGEILSAEEWGRRRAEDTRRATASTDPPPTIQPKL